MVSMGEQASEQDCRRYKSNRKEFGVVEDLELPAENIYRKVVNSRVEMLKHPNAMGCFDLVADLEGV
jgi:hypothetical protein